MTLSWNAVSGATSYEVAVIDVNTNQFVVDQTDSGTSYQASLSPGGSGKSYLASADIFVFNAHFGGDTVTGFQPGTDHDNIGHTLFEGVADLIGHAADEIGSAAVGADHLLVFDSVSKLLLQHTGDFHLV